MNDIMIDLETLGNGSNSAVISIGAVLFDPYKNQVSAEFECNIDVEDAMRYGQADGSTIAWWMNQSDEARSIFNDKHAMLLQDALIEFHDWLGANTSFHQRAVWGNGASFDPVILQNAYKKTNLQLPWKYQNVKDVRTVVDIGRKVLSIDPKKNKNSDRVPHNALDDARHQAQYVCEIIAALKAKASEPLLTAINGDAASSKAGEVH